MTLIKKLLLITYIVFNMALLQGQNQYDKGYFIDNNNVKTTCYILNKGWSDNPYSFDYKLTLNGDKQTVDIEDAKCFAIDSTLKFERHLVLLDESESSLGNYSGQRAPEFDRYELFLEVMVEGEINLYYFKKEDMIRFFVSKADAEISQLIYKKYFSAPLTIAINERFRGQLSAYMRCDDKITQQINCMSYKKIDMFKLFENYHDCANQNVKVYKQVKKRHIKLNVRAGGCVVAIDGITSTRIRDFSTKSIYGARLGAEFEYVLPSFKNKWSMIIEPTLQIERSEFSTESAFGEYSLNYLSVPIGFRRHFYLPNDSRLFINMGVSISRALNSGIVFYNLNVNGEPSSEAYSLAFSKYTPGLFFGAGFSYQNLSFELRYDGLNQNLTNRDGLFKVKYNSLSFIFAYSFDLVNR